ncbi:MAG: DUF488 family protein [Gammaproteobacteria bacterium]|nr:DUF488 family protein [Gammaproteobacteria bacterium]
MTVHIVRLGSPRQQDEGLRLGTVRRPPRGVPKSEYARRDYFDLWLPQLAPSAVLLSWATSSGRVEPGRWDTFVRRYRREMGNADNHHLLALLAALSKHTHFVAG